MWSWLERFLKSLQADTTEETDHRQQHIVPSPKQPQTRTKSIYPRERERARTKPDQELELRGQFRFPVIPDKEVATTRRKEPLDIDSPFETYKQKQKKVEKAAVSKQTDVIAPKQAESYASTNQELPFKPTQIISPIYGKIDPNKVERMIVEKTAPKESATQFPEHTTEKHETPAPQPEFLQQIAEQESAATVEEVHSIPVEQVTLRSEVLTEEPMEVREEEQPEEPVAVQEEEQPEEPVVVQEEVRPEEPAVVQEEVKSEEPAVVQEEVKPEEPVVIQEEVQPVIADEQPSAYADVPVFTQPEQSIQRPREVEELLARAGIAEHLPQQANQELAPIKPEPVTFTTWSVPTVPAPVVAPATNLESVEVTFGYEFPTISLLDQPPVLSDDSYEYTLEQKRLLEETLDNFHVNAQVVGIVKGPSVTRFELQPAPGVKVNKITGLSDDIKLNLAAKDIRIEAPIPGRNAVGIEVPNVKSEPIFLRRILDSEKFQDHPSPLAIALGMDIGGEPIVADIKKMPHGLIAGSTGSGKSVCINSIIVSLLYKATPEQVRLLLIDPKMVELAPYNHLPHLVTPVVTDAKQATAALKWAVEEMEKRYTLFVEAGVRDIERYNKQEALPLPYIVIIIDELADLMMVSPQDVEDCIIRIAQKARACGIHLLLATQRPSVDVITGNIKANVPTRLAFAVFSQIDSRTILDQSGAERLLGRGDMLFLESGTAPIRLQGNYVSDDEIDRVTEVIKNQRKPAYLFSKEDLEQTMNSYDMGEDSLFHEALVFVAEQGQGSASSLQRRFRIGYNRAARLIDMMEAEGFVSGQSGGKPRSVLITVEDAIALGEGSTLI